MQHDIPNPDEEPQQPSDPVKAAITKALFKRFWEQYGHLPPETIEALLFAHADTAIARYTQRTQQPSRPVWEQPDTPGSN